MAESYSQKDNTSLEINLEILDKANNFTDWVYGQIKPFLKGNILEIGSGKGSYSKKIINDFPDGRIILSDINTDYVSLLEEKSKKNPNVSVIKIDIERKEDFKKINIPIDSVFALNILEHVRNDRRAFKNIYNLLASEGNFIILVPVYKFLFNRIDKESGHYRRYNKKEIEEMALAAGFAIRKIFYFNALSVLGWYVNGSILRKKILSAAAVGFLNKLIPMLRFIDKYVVFQKIGISLVAVFEKKL